jgi:hypothetical protein
MTDDQASPESAGTATLPEKPAGLGQAFGCAFGLAFAGLILVPILIFILGAIVNAFNPTCGTPGDSGGCQMWAAGMALTAAIPAGIIGAVLGLAIGLRAWWRGRNKP